MLSLDIKGGEDAMHRTTVLMDEELYRAVKRSAVDHGRPMRTLVEEALRRYLGLQGHRAHKTPLRFGIYPARVKGTCSRQELYGHLKRQAA